MLAAVPISRSHRLKCKALESRGGETETPVHKAQKTDEGAHAALNDRTRGYERGVIWGMSTPQKEVIEMEDHHGHSGT